MEPSPETTLSYGRSGSGRSNVPMLVIAWLVVGIPAAWGVTQTFKQSLKLFTAPPAPAAVATQPAESR
jgi:hypothetical protein